MISESLVFHLDMLGYQTPSCVRLSISVRFRGKYRLVPVVKEGEPGHEAVLGCIKEMLTCLEDKNYTRFAGCQEAGGEVRRREGIELL